MKQKLFAFCAMILCAVSLLSSCDDNGLNNSNSIVGTWKMTEPYGGSGNVYIGYKFSANGDFEQLVISDGKTESAGNGKYTYTDNTLTILNSDGEVLRETEAVIENGKLYIYVPGYDEPGEFVRIG